jgi:hypothetical protein
MDTRGKAGRQRVAIGNAPAPTPIGQADNAAILAKLDAVLAEQHSLRLLVHRLTVPVDVLNIEQAAARLAVSVRTMERLTARELFTDARPPGRRVARVPRVYYADELEIYRTEGEPGLREHRERFGRN